MFSRSSLHRELMTHREKLGTTDNRLHQRQQMTRIKTTMAARIVYTLQPPTINHGKRHEHKSRFPSMDVVYTQRCMCGSML